MRAVIDARRTAGSRSHYAAGIAFLDRDIATTGQQEQAIAKIARRGGARGPRVARGAHQPGRPGPAGPGQPCQRFKTAASGRRSAIGALAGVDLDRKAYRVRKRAEHEVGVYFASAVRPMTITYKGMLTTMQLKPLLPGLVRRAHEGHDCDSPFALLHEHLPELAAGPALPPASPTTARSTPIQGNRNWLSAREGRLSSELLGDIRSRCCRFTTPGYSDSGTFDEVPRTAAPRRPLPAARHLA